MTALASGPDDLPWSQNGYLLFNAVRTGNLLPRLYQWNPGIQCEPLFCGTEFKALLAVSPVLVAIENEDDPVLQPFLDSAHESWGLLLFAKAGMRAVADQAVSKSLRAGLSFFDHFQGGETPEASRPPPK